MHLAVRLYCHHMSRKIPLSEITLHEGGLEETVTTTETRIVELDRDQAAHAIDVTVRAFLPDPLMQYMFAGHDAGLVTALSALFEFSCAVRFDLGWPLLGAEIDGQLVGVLGVTMPGDDTWPVSLQATYASMLDAIGRDATSRFERYAVLADAFRPTEPHYQVGFVAVAPEVQGRGIGRLLLDAIHRMSAHHPDSIGVYLDTGNPANIPFYEHMGYQTLGSNRLGDAVDIICMYRANPSSMSSEHAAPGGPDNGSISG